jgi:L-iditol 2-dehydrogenase
LTAGQAAAAGQPADPVGPDISRSALVITGPGAIGLQQIPDAAPGPGEVAIRPSFVGICGTDLELLAGVVDPAYVRYPLVPGHEWSGVVTEAGPGVRDLEPGQQVVAEGIVPCRVCPACVRGETNLCEHYDEFGFTRPGAAAGQLIVPATLVHPLAASVGLAQAALAEPAAVAWRALRRGDLRPGDRLAVLGDGTIGLLVAHLAGLLSPAEVVVHGQRAEQAGLAADLGATGFELAAAAGSGPGPYDLVIEAAGRPAAVESALALARRGGRVVLVGLAGAGATARLPVDDVVNNDLRIRASFAYTSADWAEATGLLNAGRLALRPLITHEFPLTEFAAAYRALRDGSSPRGKVLLTMAES